MSWLVTLIPLSKTMYDEGGYQIAFGASFGSSSPLKFDLTCEPLL